MAKKIVLGNWKMNLNLFQAEELLVELQNNKLLIPRNVTLGVAPPALYLNPALEILTEGKIWVGSQNVSDRESGAYTGEISASMVSSIACQFTLVGHSERRELFGESNAVCREKVDRSLENGLKVVYCCGETLEQRKSGDFKKVIRTQIEEGLFHLPKKSLSQVIVAYEPVWAIGTGETASPDQAQEVHAFIRALFEDRYDQKVASDLSILYGGSCKPENSRELFAKNDIDGGLIGGASLDGESFLKIAQSF